MATRTAERAGASARCRPRLIATLLGTALSLAVLAAPKLADPVTRAEQLSASLGLAAPSSAYARAARELGKFVEQARTDNVPVGSLERLRELADGLREQTRQKLVALEDAAQERESELEFLYRSSAWDDLSFALAAFPYWRAWVDLSLADRVADQGLRPRYIVHAQRGFRSASMQLFQPALVYGGWFGLGHVAVAEGNDGRAIEIFETLQQALAPDPDHPLAEVVAVELRLLRAKRGEVIPAPVGRATVDTTEARLLRAEATALLERQRKNQWGAKPAAERLKRVIGAGHLDDSLLAEILAYRAEIVGHDLAKYSDLVAAEYAFEHEQWFTAVQKYEAFFRAPGDTNRVDLDRFRYHQALANLHSDLVRPAVQMVEDLLARKPSDPELLAAARKLAFIAQARRFKNQQGGDHRTAVAGAAKRFLEAAPHDPDADTARLMLAETTSDTGAALRILDGVSGSGRQRRQADQTKFQLVTREFLRRAEDEEGAASRGLARQGLNVYQQLRPKDKQEKRDLDITALQMRAVSDPEPERVLKAIEAEQAREGITMAAGQALLWARLRVLDRLGDAAMQVYLEGIVAGGLRGWQLEQIYPWVSNKALDKRIAAARILLPGLAGAPSMDRRFRTLLGEALMARGDGAAAYELAKQFVADHARSGDAWRLLAQAAALTERPFEAERAWGVITDAAAAVDDNWWDGMLQRIQIRASSTRPKSACALLAQLNARAGQVPPAVRERFAALRAAVVCEPPENV